MSKRLIAVLFASLFGSIAAVAHGQTYPAKPVRLIVPYPPGGVVDIMARVVGTTLSENLGQPVVVENLAGASGIVGTEAAAKAQPDGYTILMSYFSTLSIHPSMYPKLPYEPLRDFAPVGLVARTALIAVVPAQLPVNSLQELIALAREKPGSLSYASIGNGSGSHLAAELLKSQAKIDMVQIPYKGSAPALTDLQGGHVQVIFDAMPSALPLVKAGRLKALAVTDTTRSSSAPDVPTVAESGFPGYQIAPWLGIVVPKATPELIVLRLNKALTEALQSADLKARFATLGAEPWASSPEEFGSYIRSEQVKWGKLIKDANIRPD